MAVNLIRNSKVYFTTSLLTDGTVDFANCTSANTSEIQVLDGMSFSQNTTSQTITLNEAGAAPSRGQRSFNTSIDAVEFSFSTYIRPKFNEAGSSDTLTAEESVLWNALMGANAIGSGGAWTATAAANTPSAVATYSKANSNVHQLQKFALIINVDSIQYVITNAVLNTATIDFGIDAIAAIQWAGNGASLVQSETVQTFTYKAKDVAAKYIANKLSVLTLTNTATSTAYNMPLTGGTLTISNNITYLTPQNLGVVNKPVTYFTGTRAVSGSLNAYLRAGSGSDKYTAELMADLLSASSTAADNKYAIVVKMGGTTGTRVELSIPTAMLSIPTVATEQVVSTTVNLTGQSATAGAYDIEEANELAVTYYAVA